MHLAKLARIRLTESEIKQYQKEVSDILGYVEQVQEVGDAPEEGVKRQPRVVLREDDNPHESGTFKEDLLANAPESEDGFIKVPRIL